MNILLHIIKTGKQQREQILELYSEIKTQYIIHSDLFSTEVQDLVQEYLVCSLQDVYKQYEKQIDNQTPFFDLIYYSLNPEYINKLDQIDLLQETVFNEERYLLAEIVVIANIQTINKQDFLYLYNSMCN